MKKILFVFGTRPEIIKLLPVIVKIKKSAPQIKTLLCNTAQQRSLSDQFLLQFSLKVNYDLNIMTDDQLLIELTYRLLIKINRILKKEKPDIMVIQGDTTTAFVAAIAAFYYKIPIAHVEAGLRSFNKYQPYPEEMNRRLISALSDIHFAPTRLSFQNLLHEGIPQEKIIVSGNTIVDALHLIKKSPVKKSSFSFLNFRKKLILVTTHRRENFGKPLKHICSALQKIATSYKNIQIVLPVHYNPNVRTVIKKKLSSFSNIQLLEPLPYDDFIYLMDKSYLILTDSGGVQEEAAALRKPVLVLRNVSDRPESIQAGVAKIVGTKVSTIVQAVDQLLTDKKMYRQMSRKTNLYGDGRAAIRIVVSLLRFI